MTSDVVELNLPEYAGGELPVLGKPPVIVNGVEIKMVKRIEIVCDVEEMTTIKLTFTAQVKGSAKAIGE